MEKIEFEDENVWLDSQGHQMDGGMWGVRLKTIEHMRSTLYEVEFLLYFTGDRFSSLLKDICDTHPVAISVMAGERTTVTFRFATAKGTARIDRALRILDRYGIFPLRNEAQRVDRYLTRLRCQIPESK